MEDKATIRLLQIGNEEELYHARKGVRTVRMFAELGRYEYALHKLPLYSHFFEYTAQKLLVFQKEL